MGGRCGAVVIVVSWWWGALAVGLTSTTPMLHSTHHPMLGAYNRSIGKFNSPVYNAVDRFSSYNNHLHVPPCTLYSVLHTSVPLAPIYMTTPESTQYTPDWI